MATREEDAGQSTLPELYEKWALEVIPKLAPEAAAIVEARPQNFKGLGASTLQTLAEFRYLTGNHHDFLDSAQRKALLMPLLSESDGTARQGHEFHQAAGSVRMAAVDFSQRSEDTGEAQLRDAFRDTLITFQQYLTSVDGAIAQNALSRTGKYFGSMVAVLQDQAFAGGLGLPQAAPADPWPFSGQLNGDGATLIEKIGAEAVVLGIMAKAVTRQQFIVTQRIGHFGRDTIQGALSATPNDTDEQTDRLISSAYRWWTALRDLTPAVPGMPPVG